MIVLFIPTASLKDNQPTEWLKQRLNTAIDYYKTHPKDKCAFVVAGRWKNVVDSYELTEAEVCRQYILAKLPDAVILKEDISVETGGNFAFAKPLITYFNPDKVVVFNSQVNGKRNRFLAAKIFDPKWEVEFIFLNDTFSQNERAQRKEPKALVMFTKLFAGIADGDDKSAREILLYKTPFYFKNMIVDQDFFDEYWPGGFEDFLEKRASIDNK